MSDLTSDHLSSLDLDSSSEQPAISSGLEVARVEIGMNSAGGEACMVGDEAQLNSAILDSSCTAIALTQDIELTEASTIMDKEELSLDGQGFTLSGQGNTQCLFISNSKVFVKDITLSECSGFSSPGGGAIYSLNSELDLSKCHFQENKAAASGGAIRIDGGKFSAKESIFQRNEGGNPGGALYIDDAVANLDKCTFKENKGLNGGAIYVARGPIVVKDSTFEKNVVAASGGAIFMSGSSTFLKASFEKCTFDTNESGSGGAIYALGVDANFDKCSFTKNKAVFGGAIYYNDQIPRPSSFEDSEIVDQLSIKDSEIVDQLTIKDSEIKDNTASNFAGGIGIEIVNSKNKAFKATLIRVKITGNKQEGAVKENAGAGINLSFDPFDVNDPTVIDANLVGCIFSDNTDSNAESSDLWYDSRIILNAFSTCAEGFFADGKGELACFEFEGPGPRLPCTPALPADLSGKCDKCENGLRSCCGATECVDDPEPCDLVFQELTCPSPKGKSGDEFDQEKDKENNYKKKIRGPRGMRRGGPRA
mmetsp:Transcript_19057/g.39281  ORF Transcript_19057/g.39281 Transcript_19057/m.39281 type:complete len:536 (+) Transcript_19057:172-1779(+)